MNKHPTSAQAPAWAYGALLLILLALIAIAGSFILDELRSMLTHELDYSLVAGVFWFMTMGLMLIVGAFGLWTIRLTGRMQARRSVAEVLESLGVLEDGLFTIEANLEVGAWNRSFERYAAWDGTGRPRLDRLFPTLSDEPRAALAALALQSTTGELEANCLCPDGVERALRFRSIGFGAVRLFQICDVTLMQFEQSRRRQSARLSLFADVARGLRNDLSELLFVISGHASLLQRLKPGSKEAERSIADIVKATERCESLTECFEALVSAPSEEFLPCSTPFVQIQEAANELRAMLPENHTVNVLLHMDAEPPPTALSAPQLQRIIVNLGLCLTEKAHEAKELRIAAFKGRPGVSSHLVLMCGDEQTIDRHEQFAHSELECEGLIPSVVSDILGVTGGALECLLDDDGRAAFRIGLPLFEQAPAPTRPTPL